MKMKQRILADRQRLKTLDRKGKLLFLWDYYKLPILAVVCAVVLTVVTVLTSAGAGKAAMYAVLVNTSSPAGDREALDALLEQGGIELKGRQVDLTADLHLGRELDETGDIQTVQVLAALFGISGLDFFAADEAVFEKYASQGAFLDLALFIDRQVLEARAGDLYYSQTEDGSTVLSGIVLHSGSALHRAGYYTGDIVVGVAANAQNMEEAVVFLKQLLE